MKEVAVNTLFPAKKKKLVQILDFVERNCSQSQKDEVSETLEEYDFILTFPPHDFLRCSHEVDTINPPPTEEEVTSMPTPKAKEKLKYEIQNRKKLVNGLIMEIEELSQLKQHL